MSQQLTLGLDIGTSSVRAALYDSRGEILPKTFVKTEWTFKATPDGGSEADAERTLKLVARTIDELLDGAKNIKGEIAQVASCALWHSLVGVDDRGRPTTKVLGWADTRSRDYVARLRRRFDSNAIHNRTGATFHSSFWPAKLLWLRNEFSDVFTKTARWLSLSDFVAMKLSDSWTTSVSMGSGTGLFDIRECDWDDELLRFLKMKRSQLPSLADDGFKLNSRFVKRWPQLRDSVWFPAIADGAANNIGSGCMTKDCATLMIGTSGAMRVAYEGKPPAKIPEGLWCYRVDRKRVIVGGALSDGGGLYRWLREQLNLGDLVDNEIERRPPATHGIDVMPFFFGERSTGYHENASGVILGVRASNDSVDVFQAALESVAYRFAEISDRLNRVVKVKKIIASGGALQASSVWTQIIADVLGKDLTFTNTTEASMKGAVLLALHMPGVIESTHETTNAKTVKANMSRHAAYRTARERHRSLYNALIK